jgi:ABC-2 type transport system permease protein
MTTTAPSLVPRMPSTARLLVAQIAYQARLLASGRTIIIGIGLPVLLLIAAHGHTASGAAGIAEMAAYATFGLTLTGWNTYGVRLVAARESGVLKRWRATPLPRWCYFAARILSTVVVAVVAGAATVTAGILLFHTQISVSGAVGALVVFVLGALAWAATATALTALVPTTEAAAPTFLLVYFPIIIVSGIFGGIDEPSWLSTIASCLPAQPLIHALTIALGSTGDAWPPARDLLVLGAWGAAGLAVAIVTFRWEPHRAAQRRPARTSSTAASAG